MKQKRHISLLWKMLLWLMLHLSLLAFVVFSLIFWQFRAGLDSILRGPAGDRLRVSGERMASELRNLPTNRWAEVLAQFESDNDVACDVWQPPQGWVHRAWQQAPRELMDRVQSQPFPPPNDGNRGFPDRHDRGQHQPPRDPQARFPPAPPPNNIPPFGSANEDELRGPRGMRYSAPLPPVSPIFLYREKGGAHYWAAVVLPLPGSMPDRVTWVVRADNVSGNGLFFDVKPLLLIIAGILLFSILFWLPFALGITRYMKKLKTATEQIAEGHFDVVVDTNRSDELGSLGGAIQSMSTRIDHLLRGQKRFLGDVAHELCSPLARMRTGLGILESRLPETEWNRLRDIESEASELAHLIDEILTFSRAATGMHHAKLLALPIKSLIEEVAMRETPQLAYTITMDALLQVTAEPKLLQRAVANILRNAARHAGDTASMAVRAQQENGMILLTFTDNGPGVPELEINHLFEPFYRPDLARTRDSGGTGLGLTIVKSCIEACGGSVSARNATPNGFCVEILLPAAHAP